jgi:cold shock CspA family protein
LEHRGGRIGISCALAITGWWKTVRQRHGCSGLRVYLRSKFEDLGRSQETFGKREREAKRAKKKKEKELKKQEAKGNKRSLDSPEMFAYVDEFGRIVDTPPDPTEREEINLEDIQISVPKDEDMEPVDKTRRGVVTMFNSDKGFGFIRDTDTRDSIFAHVTNMKEEVTEGDKVQFEVEQSHKGPSAIKVTIIK